MKQWLLRAFASSIRKNLAEDRRVMNLRELHKGRRILISYAPQDNYVLLLQDISRTRKMLDMTNQYIGYVYLVDENCKIRWTAHGEATQEEIANMLAMTKYLDEQRQKTPAPSIEQEQ